MRGGPGRAAAPLAGRAQRGVLGGNDRSEAMEVYAQTRILLSPLTLVFSLASVNPFLL